MKPEPTLLPCPFCGGEAEVKRQTGFLRRTFDYYSICQHYPCDLRPKTTYFATKKGAINAWNRRSSISNRLHRGELNMKYLKIIESIDAQEIKKQFDAFISQAGTVQIEQMTVTSRPSGTIVMVLLMVERAK